MPAVGRTPTGPWVALETTPCACNGAGEVIAVEAANGIAQEAANVIAQGAAKRIALGAAKRIAPIGSTARQGT